MGLPPIDNSKLGGQCVVMLGLTFNFTSTQRVLPPYTLPTFLMVTYFSISCFLTRLGLLSQHAS